MCLLQVHCRTCRLRSLPVLHKVIRLCCQHGVILVRSFIFFFLTYFPVLFPLRTTTSKVGLLPSLSTKVSPAATLCFYPTKHLCPSSTEPKSNICVFHICSFVPFAVAVNSSWLPFHAGEAPSVTLAAATPCFALFAS